MRAVPPSSTASASKVRTRHCARLWRRSAADVEAQRVPGYGPRETGKPSQGGIMLAPCPLQGSVATVVHKMANRVGELIMPLWGNLGSRVV